MTGNPQILALRREFVIAALDGAVSQAGGCCRLLGLEADREAVAAFERVLGFVRSAADEMKLIRGARVDDLTRESAAEWRATRDAAARGTKTKAGQGGAA